MYGQDVVRISHEFRSEDWKRPENAARLGGEEGNQDIIGVVEVGAGLKTKCGMGEFIRIRDVSRLSDAKKLLKDGVLEALVEEGVFEGEIHTRQP